MNKMGDRFPIHGTCLGTLGRERKCQTNAQAGAALQPHQQQEPPLIQYNPRSKPYLSPKP